MCAIPAHSELAWKTLIYMQADNDLAPYAFWDLREIAASTKAHGRSKTIVHLDLPGKDKLYEFEVLPDNKKVSQTLEDYQLATLKDYNLKMLREKNEASSKGQEKQLLDFIAKANEDYPSKNTMLVIWGHGEGYGDGTQFGGVAIDQNPEDRLGIPQLEKLLEEYYEQGHKKLSIIAMDACLMQTIEVAASLKNKSNYLIGSTQIQNFKGLPYHLINDYVELELEEEATSSDSSESYYLSKKIPFLLQEYYKDEFESETVSSLSVSELEQSFLPAFDRLFKKLNQRLETYPFEVLGLRKAISQVPFFLGQTKDLSLLLSRLEEYFLEEGAEDLARLSSRAQSALNYSILSYAYGSDYRTGEDEFYLGRFKAFGIWLPNSKKQYRQRIDKFEKSKLYASATFKSYREFLRILFEKGLL